MLYILYEMISKSTIQIKILATENVIYMITT